MTTIQGLAPMVPQAVGMSAPVGETRPAQAGMGRLSPPADAAVDISPPSRVQVERDAALDLGRRARAVEQAFERARTLVENMKAQLGGVTKQFPPFAADSDERARFLNGFSGLRAQIESLTFPPEPGLGNGWQGIEFPPARMNWEIPVLDPASAGDDQVRHAEAAVDALAEDLAVRHRRFRASIARMGGDAADQARALSERLRDDLAR